MARYSRSNTGGSALGGPNTELPWDASVEEDRRYRRILRLILVAIVVLGLAIPFVPLPEPSREAERELPPQLARLILERDTPPPEPEPEPEPEPDPEPEPEATEPEPEPEPEATPEPEPPPPSRVEQARETAARSGLMQHRDELMAMRETLDTQRVERADVTRGQSDADRVERNRLASETATDSGGIETGELSRDTGGEALAERQTTRVDNEAEAQAAARAQEPTEPRALVGRSDEAIRQVIDQHMGAIFAIYNRALRQDPTLQGKLVVRMVIEPSGEISEARIESSELNDESLEQRLLARILLIGFPDADVAVTRVNYTFDFLPR